jgi:hypothetical protein
MKRFAGDSTKAFTEEETQQLQSTGIVDMVKPRPSELIVSAPRLRLRRNW